MRHLEAADVEPVRWIIFRAYAQVLLDLYGPEAAAQYEVRSRGFMAMYLDRDPEGSFVAEGADGAPAGAVFCFVWGEVGWFGSLAVAPEHQGKGVGQALTRAAVDYLSERGCRRIGLETWPSAPLVEHLYGKFGFQPCRSTIKLARATRGAAPVPGFTARWLASGEAATLADAQTAVRRVAAAQVVAAPGEPVPDYTLEVRTPLAAGWAEALVVDDANGPAAMAVCYLRKPSGGRVAALDTRLLLVAPGAGQESALDAAVAALDARAEAYGLVSITCDVNLRYSRAAGLLRARGFGAIYELVRMERPTPGFDAHARSPLIECARWAG